MNTSRKRLCIVLWLGTMLLGLNTLAVVSGNADHFYARFSGNPDEPCDAGNGNALWTTGNERDHGFEWLPVHYFVKLPPLFRNR